MLRKVPWKKIKIFKPVKTGLVYDVIYFRGHGVSHNGNVKTEKNNVKWSNDKHFIKENNFLEGFVKHEFKLIFCLLRSRPFRFMKGWLIFQSNLSMIIKSFLSTFVQIRLRKKYCEWYNQDPFELLFFCIGTRLFIFLL